LPNVIDKVIFGIADKIRRLNRWEYQSHGRLFEEIIGHEEIKKIIGSAILSKNAVHILLVGRPGSAKTMFLLEVYRFIEASLFVIGSNATKAGLLNQLFETRPKFLLIDEIEKMNKSDQTCLLHLMETGIISETKISKTRQMELKCRVFASANSYEAIPNPLISRFLILEFPEYTFVQFKKIVLIKLKQENIREDIASRIAEKVWYELGSKDIRDAIKIGRLSRNIADVSYIIKAMKKSQ
jgi:Holliday junction DNA helicase RuvB